MIAKKNRIILVLLVILLPFLCLFHFLSGEISIGISDVIDALFDFDASNSLHVIIREFRLPRLIMAIIAGSGLSIAGLLMQTMFNNPLAGPYILGINSGSSLFVAICILSGFPFFLSDIGIISSALLGALIFGLIILTFSFFVKSHISLLLIGIMLGSFTNAIETIFQSYSNPDQLKNYTLWGMGSLQNVESSQLIIIVFFYLFAVIACLLVVKSLNTLVIGEDQALMLGISIRFVRIILIGITAVLSGLITAFCGPIAFVGLAVPNIVKLLFKTQSHFILLLGCFLIGSIFLITCDSVVQLFEATIHIPLNAVTSIIGAPFVIVIVLKRLA